MALPQSYRWSDNADGGANLYQNYACVATIKADGTTKLKWWQKEFHSKAASVAQAKRFIERWINARNSPRAYECARWRSRYTKAAAPRKSGRRQESAFDYNRLLQSNSSALSTRVIKLDAMPDDLETIADVGQSLQRFAKSSGLNAKAKASHAPRASRRTGSLASCVLSSRGEGSNVR
jgi:hypothetical protein